jgi:molybdopterin synthase catalytic subunit
MHQTDPRVVIQFEDFDLAETYAEVRALAGSQLGAVAIFVGLVRDRNKLAGDGAEVASLTLEHYPGMTEKSISRIIDQAEQRWPLQATRVIHRVGTLHPPEQIVLVAVGAAHRPAAFAAAEFIMDYLKTEAVFWKRETSAQGTRWIESTTQDRTRRASWSQGEQTKK